MTTTPRADVYLDHNATTPLKPAVRAAMADCLESCGNPSSVHRAGRAARKRVEDARQQVKTLVGADDRAVVVFTSGATEANNLALKGAPCARVLAEATAHPSVLHSGVSTENIPVQNDGLLDLAALEALLQSGGGDGTLVSVLAVNNETGVIQPVADISALTRRYGALLHVDAVQAAGRIPVDIHAWRADYLTLSAHKTGGPQGAGALVIADCLTVAAQISGGNQEKNLRAGTENVAAIAGFGLAAERAAADMPAYQALGRLRDALESALEKTAPELIFYGRTVPRVANTTMFALRGTPAETQMIALDLAGICVSNGSACASGTVRASHVLTAMGADADTAACALRVSLGWNSTEDDINALIKAWTALYNRIRSRA